QQALPEGRDERRQFFIGGLQNLPAAVESRHGATVKLREQVPLVARNDLDQVFIKRFAVGERAAFAYRRFGRLRVAVAFFGQAADEGRRVVDDLFLHGLAHLAAEQNRVSRAGLSPRRHRRNIGGDEYDESG